MLTSVKLRSTGAVYAQLMPHVHIHAHDPSLIVSEVVQGETVGIKASSHRRESTADLAA